MPPILFLDHTLLSVDTLLLHLALLSIMSLVDKHDIRDISIVVDSSSASDPLLGENSQLNPTTHDRETVGLNVNEGKSAADACKVVEVAM